MRRSTGITVTAVLIFVGCAFTLLTACVAAIASAFMAQRLGGLTHFIWLAVAFYLGLVAWGIATGVGLIRLREWARISHLIFAGLLVFGAFSMVVGSFLVKLPVQPNDPNPELTGQIASSTMIGMAAFYSILAACGVWWLYYFNRRAIRQEFGATRNTSPALVGFTPVPPSSNPARPVSISVIAVFMLFGAAGVALSLLLRSPIMVAGFVLYGWKAFLVAATLCVAHTAAGVGLFKLKLWGRTIALCLALFGLLNATLFSILPGRQALWDQVMQAGFARFPLPLNIAPPHYPLWLAMLPVIPVACVELYFLVTRKPAFVAANL